MGPERDDEDPHRGRGSTPKMTLAGQIDCVVDGRPMNLVADRQNLVITVRHWRTLLTIRSCSRAIIHPLRSFLRQSNIRLLVRIRWLGRVEVYPNPPFLVGMLFPLQ